MEETPAGGRRVAGDGDVSRRRRDACGGLSKRTGISEHRTRRPNTPTEHAPSFIYVRAHMRPPSAMLGVRREVWVLRYSLWLARPSIARVKVDFVRSTVLSYLFTMLALPRRSGFCPMLLRQTCCCSTVVATATTNDTEEAATIVTVVAMTRMAHG